MSAPRPPVVVSSWEFEPPVLRVRGVSHHYGAGDTRKQVLYDNHLEIMPGEIVIMTGPSGSGKTTLLTLIGALRTVQEGSMAVLGRELRGLSPSQLVEVRRGIGFIFQAHNLLDSLTAQQNVQMALELVEPRAEVRRTRAVEILTALGLDHRLNYKPEALSGGQRQRVAIARALANRPRLVLADEPTAALDEKSGRDVVTLLQQLAREQRSTSLIVTHDNRILDVADRIVNMVDGRIKSNVLVKESVARCEFLRKLTPFAQLTPATLANVADKMAKERHPAGTELVRQGEPGDKFYMVRRGEVDIFKEEAGGRRLLRTMGVGEFFGERALLTGEPRSATCVARTNVELYSLGKAEFQAALDASASFKQELYNIYFQRA